MVALPLFPSLAAATVAVPGATAVTSPLASTVATAPLFVAHVTMWPLSGLPLASLRLATSCCVAPSERVALAGLTDKEATGLLVTITVASALKPLPVAATTYPPGVGPAEYSPSEEMLPPVAPHTTLTTTE